jgi:hypothetical protein
LDQIQVGEAVGVEPVDAESQRVYDCSQMPVEAVLDVLEMAVAHPIADLVAHLQGQVDTLADGYPEVEEHCSDSACR